MAFGDLLRRLLAFGDLLASPRRGPRLFLLDGLLVALLGPLLVLRQSLLGLLVRLLWLQLLGLLVHLLWLPLLGLLATLGRLALLGLHLRLGLEPSGLPRRWRLLVVLRLLVLLSLLLGRLLGTLRPCGLVLLSL